MENEERGTEYDFYAKVTPMITKKDVEHIALLARLGLTEQEKKKFGSQLGQILENVAKISELDIKKIQPTSHAVELKNVFREDKAWDCLSQEKALSNAPEKEEKQFLVPRII